MGKEPEERLLDAVAGDPSICMPPLHEDKTWLMINREEQLRELLSYCETSSDLTSGPTGAYADVAHKLRAILDGEQ